MDTRQLKVCILSPLKDAYSETFIRNHIVHLPFDKVVLNGAELPALSYNDRPLLAPTLYNRVRRRLIRKFTGKQQFLEERSLDTFLSEHRIDIVLAEYGHIGALIYKACARRKIPLVVHFHGNDASHKPTLQLLQREYAEMFDYASAIVSVSTPMSQRLQQLGADPGKLFYNCYGVDTTLFTASGVKDAPPTFVAVGRFVEKKAPHLTISAFAMAKKTHPSLRLIMIGDGPLLEPCRQLVKAYNLTADVLFPGVLPPNEVAGLVSRSLAFVQHSVTAADGGAEGTPLAILEAGACAVPVISTRHEGIKDVVIEQETGLLVDEFDVQGMANAMELMAGNPAKAEAMGKNARAHIERNYNLPGHIDMLANIIKNAHQAYESKRS